MHETTKLILEATKGLPITQDKEPVVYDIQTLLAERRHQVYSPEGLVLAEEVRKQG